MFVMSYNTTVLKGLVFTFMRDILPRRHFTKGYYISITSLPLSQRTLHYYIFVRTLEALINIEDLSSPACTKCLGRWQILVKDDLIVSKWTKKLDDMRKAFKRDNEFSQKHHKTVVRTRTNMSSNSEISDRGGLG